MNGLYVAEILLSTDVENVDIDGQDSHAVYYTGTLFGVAHDFKATRCDMTGGLEIYHRETGKEDWYYMMFIDDGKEENEEDDLEWA